MGPVNGRPRPMDFVKFVREDKNTLPQSSGQAEMWGNTIPQTCSSHRALDRNQHQLMSSTDGGSRSLCGTPMHPKSTTVSVAKA